MGSKMDAPKWNTLNKKEEYYKHIGCYDEYINGTLNDEIIEQFKHYFNFHTVFGDSKIEWYIKHLQAKGVELALILNLKDKASRKTNWNLNRVVKDNFDKKDECLPMFTR